MGITPESIILRSGTVAEFTELAKRRLWEIHQFRGFSRTSHLLIECELETPHPFADNRFHSGILSGESLEKFVQQLSTFDERFILKMTFLQFVDIFEHWLRDVLRAILAHPPRVYRTKSVRANDVLSAPTLEEAKIRVIDEELEGVIRGQPCNWFSYIRTELEVQLPDKKSRQKFQEIKATRDVWVHNDGYANDTYFEKAGKKARVKRDVLNARLEISPVYFQESYDLILGLLEELGATLSEKFDQQILSYYSKQSGS